ncbi:MAG TPA: 3-hydroxyacyl-CoA dehydrogenase NAD-binding domain-containing protein, partial [Saprospiraceae bacterium]|nr:3-hydroxyacyl-CoA dehydrogenase NAD-binding domain-containing protein [Saprospiraceae bacterium]
MDISNPSLFPVAVIGAGTMGNGIAHVFAQYGFPVTMIDVMDEALSNGMSTIRKNLERMVAKEKISSANMEATLSRIKTSGSIESSVKEARLVVEAATEKVDLKLKIFTGLSQWCAPDTILATNTSSISITKIAAATDRPGQVIGMHFMNPVPVMKLVEVIRGYSTTDEIAETVVNLSKQLDKIPVVVN